MTTELERIEELDDPEFTEDDYNEPPPSDIVAYSELRSCADLFRMHQDGILEIKPKFQRDVVWTPGHQTRFIDSLIKQLPIPSMCLGLDYRRNRWIVIDGLQRVSTIIRFLSGDDWKLSKLHDINREIAGKSAASIKNSSGVLKNYYSRIQNQSLPINVLRCSFDNRSHMEYLFTIFHRLNTGGMKLNNQEIRHCIYEGTFNDLLGRLDRNSGWRKINRMTREDSNYRFVKQEIMLRFFAFLDNHEAYRGQIAKFLNDYMYKHRRAKDDFLSKKEELFKRVVTLIASNIFPDGPADRIPTYLMESILVGIAENIVQLEALPADSVRRRYWQLQERDEFSEDAVAEGLSKVIKVRNRLGAAREVFSAQ